MPNTNLPELRERSSEVIRRLDDVDSATNQSERWALVASRTIASVSDAIERGRIKRDRLSTTSPSRHRLERQLEELVEARESMTDELIRDVARLGPELAEINARLDRLLAEADVRAQSLDRFRARASEVIGYIGRILSIVGAILAFAS